MKTRLPFIALGVAIGLAGGILGLGPVPIAAAFVVLFAVAFAFALPQAYAAQTEWRPDATCPRCGVHPPTESGWCDACLEALRTSRSALHPSVVAVVRSMLEVDRPVVESQVAPTVRIGAPNGKSRSVSRAAWLRSVRLMRLLAKSDVETLEAHYADPADPSVNWTRARSQIHWRLRAGALDVRLVTRWVVNTHGRVNEVSLSGVPPTQAAAAARS